MKWYEYYIDEEGDTQYYTCDICNDIPAMALTFQDDHDHGPLCKKHWHEQIEETFNNLSRRLDDEDWGSSPELAPESPVLGKCEMCEEDMYKIYILKWCKLEYKVCANCYDKYSVK